MNVLARIVGAEAAEPGPRSRSSKCSRWARQWVVPASGAGAVVTAPNVEAQQRAQRYAKDADLTDAIAALRAGRDSILERWLEVVCRQPLHHGRREHAIADHIPLLFDALVATLERGAPIWLEPEAPL